MRPLDELIPKEPSPAEWPLTRIIRYRLLGYSPKKIAELSGLPISVVVAVLRTKGLA